MKILYFFLFCGSFLPSWIRNWIRNLNVDPDPATQINADPDTDPDPQPWIKILQNLFLVATLKVTDENNRIRIRTKIHGSATLHLNNEN